MKKTSPADLSKRPRENLKVKSKSLQPGHFPVVGIGASAGGIKALNQVLKSLNPGLGMAYVIVTHLSPRHKSALAEVIQSKIKIKVQTVTNGVKVVPNVVFVIPPKTLMTAINGRLMLRPMPRDSNGNFSIDYFFTSLAATHKNNAIGVILSGAGTDGTLGLKAIKAEGGITFAQDDTAEFDSMPRHAYESGYVDFRLSPTEIAGELEKLAGIPYLILPSDKIDEVQSKEIIEHDGELQKILAVVKATKGIDFYRDYKHASVYRRVMRRMALNKFANLQDYRAMIQTDPKEISDLYDDFLVNVTGFFRDPDFYKTLTNHVFPSILKQHKTGDTIRIWIAGCSTGEEAYSVAICLTEFLNNLNVSVPVNIFASDLDSNALEKARMGIYPIIGLRGVAPAYVDKYFFQNGNHYQITKAIRQLCIFSQHNLIKDPPFPRMNLISCQNVLIYLDIHQHEKILKTFHYALQPEMFLFLGKSESIGSMNNLFDSLDKRIKIYSRKNITTPLDLTSRRNAKDDTVKLSEQPAEFSTEKMIGNRMLSQFVFPCIVVNQDFVIVQFFGITAPFLGPGAGKASLNILKIIREELVIDVGTLLQKSKAIGKTFSKSGIQLRSKNITTDITIEVVPQPTKGDTFFMVLFRVEGIKEVLKGKQLKTKGGRDLKKIRQLEEELSESRGLVRATNEEYETTYEELQANNEEILSSNEELQSVNEELESSKEELQSALDRVTSTNLELNERNEELDRSKKELLKVNSQLEQFAFISSHDLQEPLRKTTLLSERLLDNKGDIDNEGKQYATKIKASVTRMSALIKDMLRFSLLGANDKLWIKVDLKQIVTAVIEDFERTIEEKKAEITIGELPQIIGEPFQMNQLFHHLLDNALKFSSNDPHISISSREMASDDYSKYLELNKQMKYFVIDVRDNGIGFDEMFSDKIFHLFQQLRDDEEVEGTGVGLALCRKIVETHGGFLFGHGKKGVGAIFTLYFPVR